MAQPVGTENPQPSTDPSVTETAPAPEPLDEARLSTALRPREGGTTATAIAAAPQLQPPGTVAATQATQNAGVFANVRVISLYSSAHQLNCWAFLEGIGWKRLATTNPSAHTNLSLLTAASRLQGTPAAIRHEADNQIHEIYVW